MALADSGAAQSMYPCGIEEISEICQRKRLFNSSAAFTSPAIHFRHSQDSGTVPTRSPPAICKLSSSILVVALPIDVCLWSRRHLIKASQAGGSMTGNSKFNALISLNEYRPY
jgi:hypothetical protein